MKQILILLGAVSVLLAACLLTACASTPAAPETPTAAPTEAPTQAPAPETAEPLTQPSAEPETVPETEPVTEEETKAQKPQPEPGTLKVLAVGNSFSVDAMEYVYQVAENLGYEKIILGNLYIGGCTIDVHWKNAKGDLPAYDFYTNTTGTWEKREGATIAEGLAFAEWDYITVQQASGSSGVASTYRYLPDLVDYLTERQPNARILWHMTWAYQSDAAHAEFPKYGKSQQKMYDSILAAYEKKVAVLDTVDGMIPSGTAIQNMRTSFVGDHLTRDGYHMDQGIGRYILAMTWVGAITGADIDAVTWTPAAAGINPVLLAAVKESVKAAVSKPLEVTPSTYTEKPTAEDYFRAMGLKREDFDVLDLDVLECAFYNSADKTHGKRISKLAGYSSPLLDQFAATRIFTREDLPVGSVILLEEGYQYRPEGWIDLETVNPGVKRPINTTAAFVVVSEEWWGEWNLRAFNLAAVGSPQLDAEGMEKLCGVMTILVPKK